MNAAARERLSALLDGELDRDAVAQACAHWRESEAQQSAWHAYHLIGDVLRSDDLASHPAHDSAFLLALRARLADEPVVLAPQREPALDDEAQVSEAVVLRQAAHAVAQPPRRRAWLTPASVAAGFVLVAGVLTLSRPDLLPSSGAGEPLLQANAGARPGPRPVSTTATPRAAAAPVEQPTFATGQMIRDARLDRYLSAHQQFAGSSALGVPSAYLRNATVELPGH